MKIRVRFAPSPTGYLHVGGARTALFNWLFARANKGVFILRIEDTDRARYTPEAEKEIFESLNWLGLSWDEGPKTEGEVGPYYQSQRTGLYQKEIQKLIKEGKAYRCFCTAERLQKVREEQKNKKSGTSGYDRHCRNLSSEEEQRLLSEGKPFVVRFKVPFDRTVVFNDLIRGEIEYNSNILDDLVLMKSDGFPTYHLANVIDDHYMQISHVLRGDEWIPSTPRHVLIYEAFGWELPQFAHLPVILAPNGGKLSKRKGAASVTDYKKAGYLPEALLNFLSLLGWAPGDDREIMSVDDIIKAFSLDRISPKSSVFDEKKLEWINGHYLRNTDTDKIFNSVVDRWEKAGLINQLDSRNKEYCYKVIDLLKDRSKTISEITDNAFYFFFDPKEYDAKGARKHFKEGSIPVLKALNEKLEALKSFNHDALENVYREYAENSKLSASKLIHPTRLAVSGVSFGPGLFELLETIGKETTVRRIKTAITWIERITTKHD